MAHGPELALLAYLNQQCVLLRGRWIKVGDASHWWDLDAEETIDIPIIAWAPLPTDQELLAFTADARGVGFH
jgi:hypothetical protein